MLLLSLCPISCSSDSTVTIFENAKDSSSTFKFHSFRFQRLEKVSTVWLHCEVQVCDGDRLVCQPVGTPLLEFLLFPPSLSFDLHFLLPNSNIITLFDSLNTVILLTGFYESEKVPLYWYLNWCTFIALLSRLWSVSSVFSRLRALSEVCHQRQGPRGGFLQLSFTLKVPVRDFYNPVNFSS